MNDITWVMALIFVLAAFILVFVIVRKRRRARTVVPALDPPHEGQPLREFKIFTLGASGAGKTCFMASLYNRLKSNTVDLGFYLRVSGEQHARLTQIYNVMTDPAGDWPAGTVNERQWAFTTCASSPYASAVFPAFQFTYLDYAGGHLKDAAQVGSLDPSSHIEASDAVLVLIDGQKILQRLQGREHRDPNERLGGDLNFLMPYLNTGVTRPVHFVVSKSDLIEPHYDLKRVRDCLLEFPAFRDFVAWRAKLGLPTRLIPVSAVGQGFAKLNEQGVMLKNQHKVPEPKDIEISMAATLSDMFESTAIRLSQHQMELVGQLAIRPADGRALQRFANALTYMKDFPFPWNVPAVIVPMLRDFFAFRTASPDELRQHSNQALGQVRDMQSAVWSVIASQRAVLRVYEDRNPASLLVSGRGRFDAVRSEASAATRISQRA
jgi:hypothetical protein